MGVASRLEVRVHLIQIEVGVGAVEVIAQARVSRRRNGIWTEDAAVAGGALKDVLRLEDVGRARIDLDEVAAERHYGHEGGSEERRAESKAQGLDKHVLRGLAPPEGLRAELVGRPPRGGATARENLDFSVPKEIT